MPLNLIRRLIKGSAITAAEHDANLDELESAIDGKEPSGTAAAAVTAHEQAADPHPTYLTLAEGQAAFDALGAAAAAQSAAEGTAGAALTAHQAAGDPHPAYALEADLGGAAALDVGTTAGTVAAGDDARLSDARTPTAHASTHATGQADALTPADIGAATAAQGALADSALQPGDLTGMPFRALVSLTSPTGNLAAGANIERFTLTDAITLTSVGMESTGTAPTGSSMIVDVNNGVGGSSILGNKLEIEATESDTDTATTAPTIVTASLPAGTVLSFDADQVGATEPGAGVKVRLEGTYQ